MHDLVVEVIAQINWHVHLEGEEEPRWIAEVKW
jgi:hypothetical protein